jgi:hypothetical protein
VIGETCQRIDHCSSTQEGLSIEEVIGDLKHTQRSDFVYLPLENHAPAVKGCALNANEKLWPLERLAMLLPLGGAA